MDLALAWAAATRLLDTQPVIGGTLAGVLALVGIAEVGWGLTALVIDRVATPRLARGTALAPVAAWALVLVGGAATGSLALPFLPLGTATMFDLFIAGGLSVHLRSKRREPSRRSGDSASMHGALLLGLVAAGLAISVFVTPALSETVSWSQQAPPSQSTTSEHGSH